MSVEESRREQYLAEAESGNEETGLTVKECKLKKKKKKRIP